MIFRKMTLENYGLFSGVNEFDLSPNRAKKGPKKKRPIVLFGGKNGAGKTTFLGATRLLLYGKQSLEGKPSQLEYEKELISHLHRNKSAATSAEHCRIGLEFDHVVNGEKNTYYVERSWTLKPNNRTQESFKVDKDGAPLTEVNPSHWESFIADIVPARLSQLFFFDGEKIKNIAEDLSSNVAIAEAIQSLLGIDNVLSLKSDLRVYKSRLLKESGSEDYNTRITSKELEIKELESELSRKIEDRAPIQNAYDSEELATKKLEIELESMGGDFAALRGANKQKVEHYKELIQSSEARIRTLADSILPFAFCPNISKALSKQLSQEELLQSRAATQESVATLQKELLAKASNLVTPEKDSITQFLESNIEAYLAELQAETSVAPLHQLSPRESQAQQNILGSQTSSVTAETLGEISKLETISLDLHRVSKELEQAPAEEDITETVDKLRKNSKALGELNSQLENLDASISTIESNIALLRRDIEKLEKSAKSKAKHTEKLDHLEKLGPALEAYQEQLTKSKIQTLRAEVTECFNRLARKSDFVKGIDIDHKTFAVTLLDEHERSIPREDLSSGEKQIFAIAMLWGLARTSGRPLPVVIDTPLGRLDSDHRKKLIQNYFPNAGHQVILLSTDTEVDQNLYSQLSPHISQSYHLVYDHNKGHTTATEGSYFWDSE